MNKATLRAMGILASLFILVSGCAKKADPNKPIEQIQADVQKMSVSDLEANAKVYADAILAKKGEVEKVSDQMKQLKITELMGDKAKVLRDQLSKIGTDVSALTQRYDIYAKKYQELGGDVSKIKIS